MVIHVGSSGCATEADLHACIDARELALAAAAHELRTPVTVVRGYAQLLLDRLRPADAHECTPDAAKTSGAAEACAALGTIIEQTRVMDRLVRDMLDSCRGAGGLSLSKEVTDAAYLVRRVVSVTQSRLPAAPLVLHTPADPLPALVDPMRIEQVVGNLVDNALKYGPVGAPVEVTVAADALGDGQLLLISVRDHGPGVPPSLRERIFEPYFRAGNLSRAAGLGLGLAICRDVVAAHGGAITVYDADGGGACFCVTLPRGLTAA